MSRFDVASGSLKKTHRERFEALYCPEALSGCWLWQGRVNIKGYGRHQINKRREFAHRVAYEMYTGPIPPGMVVMHTCDVPACVNPNHLRIGTNEENMRDMARKGRAARGERGAHARLTSDDVLEIRRLRKLRVSQTAVAARFGITYQHVQSIEHRRQWKHLEDVAPPRCCIVAGDYHPCAEHAAEMDEAEARERWDEGKHAALMCAGGMR